jgi:hypothetical protein
MRFLFSIALALLLCGLALGRAAPPPAPPKAKGPRPPIRDKAKLFSAAAVERANRLLGEVREKYDIDLYLDTFKELPGAYAEQFRQLKTREKARFFRDTAQKLADEEGVDGLYVLVTTDPRNVVLVGWPERREDETRLLEKRGGFSSTKRNELRRRFAREIAEDPDHALSVLVDRFRIYVESRVQRAPSPLGTIQAALVVGSALGLWVLLSLLRRARALREAGATHEPVRGLYQPALLASLFGVPAGFWVYDRLFRLERPTAPLGPLPPIHAALAEEPPESPSTGVIKDES